MPDNICLFTDEEIEAACDALTASCGRPDIILSPAPDVPYDDRAFTEFMRVSDRVSYEQKRLLGIAVLENRCLSPEEEQRFIALTKEFEVKLAEMELTRAQRQ